MQQNNPQKGTVEISTIAAMAIVAAIVATASIYITIKYLEIPDISKPVTVIAPTVKPIASATPTPIADKTAGWQTYANSKEGFEIKYPQDFKINESQDAPQVVNFNRILCCQFSFDDGMDLQINYIPNTVGGYPDINDVLKNKKTILSQETFSIQKYNYGNFEGVKAVSIGNGAGMVKQEYIDLYLKVDNGFYSFAWSSLDPKNKGFNSADYLLPMLSTFKLTEKDSLTDKIKVFFINTSVPNDKGTVGCGDEAVGIDRIITPTATPLKAALENLLSTSQAVLDNGIGLYNSLAKQNWKLESVSIVEGEAIIKFSGKYIGFGVCEDPRIKAQIEKTALQFPTVKKVSIFVGGVSLDKLTSGR